MRKCFWILAIVLLAYAGLAWGGEITLEWSIECKKWGPEERTIELCGDCPEGKIVGYYRECLESGVVEGSINQVTAYKASDGALFETKDRATEHEAAILRQKKREALHNLFGLDHWHDEDINVYRGIAKAIYLIEANYEEIKAIMEE